MSDIPSIITFSENIADAEAPKPLPAGDYSATIETVTPKMSQSGKLGCMVQYRISPDQFPADFDAESYPEGMTVNQWQGLDDTAIGRYRLKRFLDAIGAPASKEIDVTAWVGLTATVNLGTESYEGVDRNTIKSVKR